MGYKEFDPDNITSSDMKRLADAIEDYIELLEEVMIIPDELKDDYGDKIDKAIERAKKLIKKLRHGDRSVFKEPDDWESLPSYDF